MKKIPELIRQISELHTQIQIKEEELKELKQQKERISTELYTLLQQENLDKITVDGVTVYPREDIYISLPKNRQEAIDWLLENGYADFIRPYIPSQTLTALLKEAINEQPELKETIQKLFNYTEKKRVGIRR